MSPETVFSLTSAVALVSWMLLIVAGRLRPFVSRITGTVVPLLFAVLYAALIATQWSRKTGGFGSLAQVRALFSNDWLLLAGWVHYLAFDLFIGSWQVRDSQKRGISHLLVIACLVLTFLFGPAGLLLYFLIRTIHPPARHAG